MAAEIIEELDELEATAEAQDLPQDPHEATPDEIVADFESPQAEPEVEDDDVPEKYRGKSFREVVGMHQNAEQLLGKHSGEVGELRKLVDTYILNQLSPGESQAEEPEESEVDFFEDPNTAVNKAIERHPVVQQAQKQAAEMQHQTAMAQLQQKHPDMGAIVGDTKFLEWIQASKVRTQLFKEADQNFNAEVADELITLYKERQGVAQQTAQVETQARKQQARAAQTGSQGQGNSGGSKRIYRRADIIKLMKADPDRYEALSPELMQAYAEGRVR